VGIVAPKDRTKGLFRDVETIVWSLRSAHEITTTILSVDGNLYAEKYNGDSNKEYQVFEEKSIYNKTFHSWASEIDIIIIIEALNPNLIDELNYYENIRQIVYIPNLEWAVVDPRGEDTRPWEALCKSIGSRLLTIARSKSIYRKLSSLSIPVVFVDWSIPDEIIARDYGKSSKSCITVLFNGGNLGFRERRGLDVIIKAFELIGVPPVPLELIIKCNKDNSGFKSLGARKNLSLIVDARFIPDREELLSYYDRADVVLYPSRFEGLGLSLLEAIHRGCYVLATDGEPMSDLIPDGWLRIRAQRMGLIKLAPLYEPDPQSLVECIRKLIAYPELLKCDLSMIYVERQKKFQRDMIALMRMIAQ
jgi:glycosyltransferase involved in cell wall biosynthesis